MTQFRQTWAGRLLPWIAGSLLITTSVGCQARGNVSGRVTFQGKPLVFGTVLLVAADGTAHQGTIDENGNYTIASVPTGRARVAINSPDPTAPVANKSGIKDLEGDRRRAELKIRWVPIPPHYGDPNKSDLTLEVKGGKNPHNLELK
jgi:hypothetical protein